VSNKEKEIKELHDFFEHGKLYWLETTIPVYKNKECFELKTWSWFNHEESLYLDLKNISNTRTSYTASNIKNVITVTTPMDVGASLSSYIKKPKKIMMFLGFIKNSDNIRGADDRTSVMYHHPLPSVIRTLSHAACLKFLYQSQIIYVPIHPGQQKTLFQKQETNVAIL
jgi:hypothetical protein